MRITCWQYKMGGHHTEYNLDLREVLALWVSVPILLEEDEICSLQEEYDSFENLPFEEEWDDVLHR